jgi:antitoxin component YwqK of YwqJK toxin-antitoxin module
MVKKLNNNMKIVFVFAASLSLSINALGQVVIDSGFTNKAEAKNQMVNGIKEGKWMEYVLNDVEKITDDSSKARYYRLAVYKVGVLNGLVRSYEKDGEIHSTGFYSNGKKSGDYKFYEEGHVVLSIPYIDDKETGVAKFYPSPNDTSSFSGIMEISYIDGKKNGVEKEYYKSGKIMWEDTIINGKRDGIYRIYYESGKLKSETLYTNGVKGIVKNYDENGNEIK